MIKHRIILLIILVSLAAVVHAIQLDSVFQKAVTAFENKDYEASLDMFLSLENEGINNPDLYYNIGNCYFRLSSFGKSILYYKKALKIDRDHKAAQRNLEFVLTFTQDKQVEEEPDLISSIWLRLQNSLSLNTLALVILVLFTIIILLLVLIMTRYRHRDKTSLIFIFSVTLLLIIVLSVISIVKYDARNSNSEAVLIATSAIGYSGPGEDFTRVFTIHEGMIFQVEKTEAEWSLIKLANGLGGWVRSNTFLKV